MIYQESRDLQPVAFAGCYFCSIGRIAEKISNKVLTAEQIMKVYAEAVCCQVMDWNCYIQKPDTVGNLYLYELKDPHKIEYVGWWNADSDIEWFGPHRNYDYEVTRHQFGEIHHFNLSDWDPHPGLDLGPVDGRRFFRVIYK